MAHFDRIQIKNWRINVVIGVYEEEQLQPQPLDLKLSLWGPFHQAALNDQLDQTIDYAQIYQQLNQWIDGQSWNLLESFAHDFCRQVLTFPMINKVKLTVNKPQALAPALVRYTCKLSK